MQQMIFDKHTIDLLERLVLAVENINNRIEYIEGALDSIEKNTEYIETMLENSDGI